MKTAEQEAREIVEQIELFVGGFDHLGTIHARQLVMRALSSRDEALSATKAEVERLNNLCDRLKLEAQCHAQEARAANSTIREGYQAATGAKGEPGNWNGAEPFKALVARAEAAEAREAEARKVIEEFSCDCSWHHGYTCKRCAYLASTPSPEPSKGAGTDFSVLVNALRECRSRLKMDFDEVRHLRSWLSPAERAERQEQDEAADEASEEAIRVADAALSQFQRSEGK